MTVVLDSSVVVSGIVDSGKDGRWAETVLGERDLVAPHLMPIEATNILRRSVAAGLLSPDTGRQSLELLGQLPVNLLSFSDFATRIWSLGDNVTSYDAWYVAIAEALDAPLATLNHRLARATGPRCRFLVPPEN